MTTVRLNAITGSHGLVRAQVSAIDVADMALAESVNASLDRTYSIACSVLAHVDTNAIHRETEGAVEIVKAVMADRQRQDEDAYRQLFESRLAVIENTHLSEMQQMVDNMKREELALRERHAVEMCELRAQLKMSEATIAMQNELLEHKPDIESLNDKLALVRSEERDKYTQAKHESDLEYRQMIEALNNKLVIVQEESRSSIDSLRLEHGRLECSRELTHAAEIDQLRHQLDIAQRELQEMNKYKQIEDLVDTKMENINRLVRSQDNNQLGESGEQLVFNFIRSQIGLANGSIERVNGKANHGDMFLRYGNLLLCIEVKNHTDSVTKTHVDRFINTDSRRIDYNAGLFISVKSDFAHSTGVTDFHIRIVDGKPLMFVANVVNNMHTIISAIKTLSYLVDRQESDGESVHEYMQKLNSQLSSVRLMRTQIGIMKKSVADMEAIAVNAEKALVPTPIDISNGKYVCENCSTTFRLKRELKRHTCSEQRS